MFDVPYVSVSAARLLVYPIGIPIYFIYLLYAYKVPQIARMRTETAWLQQLIEHSWRIQMDNDSDGVAPAGVSPPPPVDVRAAPYPRITVDAITAETIRDEDIDFLYLLLIGSMLEGQGNDEAGKAEPTTGDTPEVDAAPAALVKSAEGPSSSGAPSPDGGEAIVRQPALLTVRRPRKHSCFGFDTPLPGTATAGP